MSARKKATKVMRGHEKDSHWSIQTASGAGKKWNQYRVSDKPGLVIVSFVEMAQQNKDKVFNTRTGMLAIRLLAPGGIIAAEHGVKPHRDPRTKFVAPTKRPLKSTAQLKSSIAKDTDTDDDRDPSLINAPALSGNYPHQTTLRTRKD